MMKKDKYLILKHAYWIRSCYSLNLFNFEKGKILNTKRWDGELFNIHVETLQVQSLDIIKIESWVINDITTYQGREWWVPNSMKTTEDKSVIIGDSIILTQKVHVASMVIATAWSRFLMPGLLKWKRLIDGLREKKLPGEKRDGAV